MKVKSDSAKPLIHGDKRYSWNTKERGEAKRPFRLWDAQRRKNMPWRAYGSARNAHNAALLEVRWAALHESIEVYDVRTGRLHGQYTRRVDSVFFQAA